MHRRSVLKLNGVPRGLATGDRPLSVGLGFGVVRFSLPGTLPRILGPPGIHLPLWLVLGLPCHPRLHPLDLSCPPPALHRSFLSSAFDFRAYLSRACW